MVDDLVRRRAARLASGLRRVGASTGAVMPILVCDDHVIDREVACLAAVLHGATPSPLSFGADLRCHLEQHRASVLVACAEGVVAWRASGVPMRVVGDGADVVWWRALELREAQ